MSIISCPQCGKKISSQAPMCLGCGAHKSEITDEQELVFRKRRVRDRIYRLKMISYAIMAVFLIGFGWYWWASSGFQLVTDSGPFILMGISAVAYLANRVLLFQAQRKQKGLNRLRF